jgi:hypothetical protein
MVSVLFSPLSILAEATKATSTPSSIKVEVDGKAFTPQKPPMQVGTQVYLYLRDLLGYYGYSYQAEAFEPGKPVCYVGDEQIFFEYYQFTNNSTSVKYSDRDGKSKEFKLDFKVIKDNKGDYYIPSSFVTKVMGGKYTYDTKTKTLKITSNRKPVNLSKPMFDGFVRYSADGFKIQIPKDWEAVFSRAEASDMEKHYLWFKMYDIYTTEIQITHESYEDFINYYGPEYFKNYEKIKILNADVAYSNKSYSEYIDGVSTYKIIAFKGDICYTLYAQCSLPAMDYNLIGQAYLNQYAEEIDQYKNDINNMFYSFELTSEPISFDEITSTTTLPDDYHDMVNNISRSSTKALDENGLLISAGDIVSRGGFSGQVIQTKGSQILVYWNAKSSMISNLKKDIDYWSSIAGVKYKTQQWIDSKLVLVKH